MPFPPPALPTNRSNATFQQGTHPGDHNAVNQAVNDTVAALLDERNRINTLYSAVSHYVNGANIGAVGPTDFNGYNAVTWTASRTGIVLADGTFAINYVDGDFATVAMTLFIEDGAARTDQQVVWSEQSTLTFHLHESLRIQAGQRIFMQMRRVNGAARFILNADPRFNGASFLEGLVAQWV